MGLCDIFIIIIIYYLLLIYLFIMFTWFKFGFFCICDGEINFTKEIRQIIHGFLLVIHCGWSILTFLVGGSSVELQLSADCIVATVQETGVNDKVSKLAIQLNLIGVILPEWLQHTCQTY